MADKVVQLGFALTIHTDNDDGRSHDSSSPQDNPPSLCHQSPYWSNWDGGKIGGKPNWLNPRDIPKQILRCHGPCSTNKGGEDNNGTVLKFVTQLYCPADGVTDNEAAFHRSLYAFACPTCCSSQTLTSIVTKDGEEEEESKAATTINNHLSNCIRILRCQLPKQNDFYPPTGSNNNNNRNSSKEWTKHTSEFWSKSTNNDKLNLCEICGQCSKGKCPKQQKWFCGPQHQKECLRVSKEDDGASSDVKYSDVCYESELVVEEEPVNITTSATSETEDSKTDTTLFPSKDITDADANLEQSDLNALTGNISLAQAATGVTDPTTLAFYARMAIGGEENDVRDQCLRYCRWPEKKEEISDGNEEEDEDEDEEGVGPLWLSSNNRPPTDTVSSAFPPPCQYCGAPRLFEFQILPQMLHYLLQGSDSTKDDDDSNTNRQVLTEAERAILLEAKSKIESGIDLPLGFKEQHDKILANARESLLGGGSKKNGTSNNTTLTQQQGGDKEGGVLDWGTVAVYTCTASCGDGYVLSENDINGAYREEVAWMQPPLD